MLPHHPGLVANLPTLEEVEASVRAIRREMRWMRWLHWGLMSFFGGVILLYYASEADSVLSYVATQALIRANVPPEAAHALVMWLARLDFLPVDTGTDDPHLKSVVCGLPFPNPVGLAAGFDKHCTRPAAFMKLGFGHVEVGTVTAFPQPGNPKPRIFRLPADRAIVNRCGFNSVGVERFARNLRRAARHRFADELARNSVLGVNVGRNKESRRDPAWDYAETARRVAPYADYLVVNVSSPNTPGLRDLQKGDELARIVRAVREVLAALEKDVFRQRKEVLEYLRQTKKDLPKDDDSFPFGLPNLTGKIPPLFVKIAPDLSDEQVQSIVQVILREKVDGVIVCNTTVSRPASLAGLAAGEAGGLSGAPLREMSTRLVHRVAQLTRGTVPIIAVGGVATGEDALEKIEAGASLVQIYSAFVYGGPGAARLIKRQLASLMYSKGYKSLSDAVGAAHRREKRANPLETGLGHPVNKAHRNVVEKPAFKDTS